MISISLISKSIEADTKKLIENISSNPDKEQELVDQFISETNRKIEYSGLGVRAVRWLGNRLAII